MYTLFQIDEHVHDFDHIFQKVFLSLLSILLYSNAFIFWHMNCCSFSAFYSCQIKYFAVCLVSDLIANREKRRKPTYFSIFVHTFSYLNISLWRLRNWITWNKFHRVKWDSFKQTVKLIHETVLIYNCNHEEKR